jgi:hypothetical protein
MNEAYDLYFSNLSDRELDGAIVTITDSCKTLQGPDRAVMESLGMKAAGEWRRRHPGTICPTMYNRAMDSGGFPSCYSGPTDTIVLD